MKKSNVNYKEFNLKTLIKELVIPSWQRWMDANNIKSLSSSVATYGQLRPILIAILPDGTKVLADGNHLLQAAIELNLKTIAAFIVKAPSETEAHKMFNTFNTTGKSLTATDHIVGQAAAGNKDYKRFMSEVLNSPSSEKGAKSVYTGQIFTLPSLYNIFFDFDNRGSLKKGKAKLVKDFERKLELVKFLDVRYIKHPSIIAHRNKNGKSMKLNGGSIIPVFNSLTKRGYFNGNHTNEEILQLLVDFTIWFYNTMDGVQYNKDNMSKFNDYLDQKTV